MWDGDQEARIRQAIGRLISSAGWLAAVAVGCFAFVTWAGGVDRVARQIESRIVPMTSQKFSERIDGVELEADGLRARLSGVHARSPRTILVPEPATPGPPPPVCAPAIRMEGMGRDVTVAVAERADSLDGWFYRIEEDTPVGDCRTWSWGSDGLLCEPYRLGVFSIVAEASGIWEQGGPMTADAFAGVAYRRSPIAPLELQIGVRPFPLSGELRFQWRRPLLGR